MKKLLLIAALATIATTAMAAPAAPKAGDTATTDVEVRAEIVNDSLVITDLTGGPIVIDFKKQPQKAHKADKIVGYKVTAATAITGADITLTPTIGTAGGQTTPVTLLNPTSTTDLKANLKLEENKLTMAKDTDVAYGHIHAQLDVKGTEDVGNYVGHTELKVVVATPGK